MKIVEFSERGKWIHFEYVPGGTLYDSLKYGRLFNCGDKFKILNGIAITMNFLHDRGITHLDIRLESIIVTIAENKPVLADVDMMINLILVQILKQLKIQMIQNVPIFIHME